MASIVIVEDNADLLDDIAFNLRQAGYEVTPMRDGTILDDWMLEHALDVLVLDIGLPGEDGLSIARRLRQKRSNIGIVMLTARGAVDDRILGLEIGADAYLAKPTDLRELAAVIGALIRRLSFDSHNSTRGHLQSAWALSSSQLELIAPNGNPISLSHNEFCVLKAAASAPSNLVSRKVLIEALGHKDWYYDERRLETLISRLRRKLAPHIPEGFPVRGIKGHGYLFGIDLQEII
jgi:DNA-binding response OmpR family regulator